jgi:hypothetical protein
VITEDDECPHLHRKATDDGGSFYEWCTDCGSDLSFVDYGHYAPPSGRVEETA